MNSLPSPAPKLRGRRVGAALAAVVGLATLALVLWRWPKVEAPVPPPPPPADRFDVPPLPPYIMNMAGGDIDIHAATPGDPMGPPVIADEGARLEVAVRAELEVKIRVHVKLFWRMVDQLRRWQPSGQYGPFSTYRYRGTGEMPFGPGKGDLVVIVSPVADIPDEIHASWLSHPPRHWQVMRQPVVWRRPLQRNPK
jgi:hypothetical protein